MDTSLKGKVAIVTGVSHDGQVGQAVAKALADRGAALAICARSQANVEARAAELRQAGTKVFAFAGSLTDEAQVAKLIEGTAVEFGRIDILVNLAGGLTRYKPAVEHTLEDWTSEVNNNLLSAFLTSRAAFPHMKAAGGGSIINFSRAGQPQANMVAYNCAKAGIDALTRTFALDVLALYVAFLVNFRAGRSFEELELTRLHLLFRTVSPRGEARDWRYNPLWTRIDREEDEEFGLPATLKKLMRDEGIDPESRRIRVGSYDLTEEAYGAVPLTVAGRPLAAG